MKQFTSAWVQSNPEIAAEKLNLYAERIVSLESALGAESPGDLDGAQVVIEVPVGAAMLKTHNPS